MQRSWLCTEFWPAVKKMCAESVYNFFKNKNSYMRVLSPSFSPLVMILPIAALMVSGGMFALHVQRVYWICCCVNILHKMTYHTHVYIIIIVIIIIMIIIIIIIIISSPRLSWLTTCFMHRLITVNYYFAWWHIIHI